MSVVGARARPFADLVLHVFAHVPGDAAASVWDPAYVAWSEARVGPARARHLAEDAAALARLAPSHDALARAQLVAWLFADLPRARAAFARSLAELGAADVGDAAALAAVAGDPAAELAWCAAALEDEAHGRLPAIEPRGVAEAARALADVAPGLASFSFAVVRSLRLRGRVRGREIWVGEPGAGPTLDHVAWQAAHEATVAELGARAPRLDMGDREHAAVALLCERARRAGRAKGHAAWLGALRAPDPRLESLAPAARDAVLAALGGP